MDPKYINRKNHFNNSFTLSKHRYPHFLKIWHYHPEMELVYVKSSTGTRFIGDSIRKFEPGDMILLGEGLPHMWMNDDDYFRKNSNLSAEAWVIHIDNEIINTLTRMPEMKPCFDLLNQSDRGILFSRKSTNEALKLFEIMFDQNPCEKMLTLFQMLHVLKQDKNMEFISGSGFTESFNTHKGKRLFKVYEYILNNFKRPIGLEEVANLANMNKAAFCRYFKRVNKMTFSKYLNETRIAYACKLLLEERHTISEIAYASGYNNVSHFNRQFKVFKKVSPSQYLNSYLSSQ